MFTRRVDFFSEGRHEGEAWSDFAACLEKMGNEADWSNFSIHDIYVMRHLCRIADKEFEELFFKEKNPKKEELVRIGKQHEVGQNSMAFIYTEEKNVAATHEYQNKPPICLFCGMKGHLAQSCCKLKAERGGYNSSKGKKNNQNQNQAHKIHLSNRNVEKASCITISM